MQTKALEAQSLSGGEEADHHAFHTEYNKSSNRVYSLSLHKMTCCFCQFSGMLFSVAYDGVHEEV